MAIQTAALNNPCCMCGAVACPQVGVRAILNIVSFSGLTSYGIPAGQYPVTRRFMSKSINAEIQSPIFPSGKASVKITIDRLSGYVSIDLQGNANIISIAAALIDLIGEPSDDGHGNTETDSFTAVSGTFNDTQTIASIDVSVGDEYTVGQMDADLNAMLAPYDNLATVLNVLKQLNAQAGNGTRPECEFTVQYGNAGNFPNPLFIYGTGGEPVHFHCEQFFSTIVPLYLQSPFIQTDPSIGQLQIAFGDNPPEFPPSTARTQSEMFFSDVGQDVPISCAAEKEIMWSTVAGVYCYQVSTQEIIGPSPQPATYVFSTVTVTAGQEFDPPPLTQVNGWTWKNIQSGMAAAGPCS